MKKIIVAGVALAVAAAVAVPAVALADGSNGGTVNCQVSQWSTSTTTTASRSWHTVLTMQGLAVPDTPAGPVTATLSVELSGAPVDVEVVFGSLQLGVPVTVFNPGAVRFVPPSRALDSASFTFTDDVTTISSSTIPVTVQWRSTNGQTATLDKASLGVVYFNGNPSACTPTGT